MGTARAIGRQYCGQVVRFQKRNLSSNLSKNFAAEFEPKSLMMNEWKYHLSLYLFV
jgi:hypothetical protein